MKPNKFQLIFAFLCLLVCILGTAIACFAEVNDSKAVRAIIGEASSEGYDGMLAVACAIRNRGTLQGVYGVNAKHVDNEPKWVWDIAERAWHNSLTNDVTKGATHWESTDFKVPYWAKDMVVTYTYKKHVFYKELKED